MINAILGLVLFGAFWTLLYYLRRDTLKRGKVEEEAEAIKDMLDDVHLAKIARDRLSIDAAYRAKLRSKYERRQ